VGKKGANNVASLVVKTLTRLNLLREDSVGELNIIFDNCSGQNKNNTVLKLAAWLKAMGYFRRVNFIFLVVGHTKNAADRLFNSLKHEYRKQDIFTMEVLIRKLSASDCVTVIPTVPDDFSTTTSCSRNCTDRWRAKSSKIPSSLASMMTR
jgi:folylpolyglutamate synthase/dihydropteroate synthase